MNKPIKRENLKIGTILRDKDGCQHQVKGFRDKFILMSKRNDFNKTGHLWTIEEINGRKNIIIN